nr:MetQ/NlpA family ABC transporter substrate-binding protein [Aquicella siphonis]
MAGDYLAERRSLRPVLLLSALLWAACFTYQFWPKAALAEDTIRVGVMSGQSEEVMKAAASVARNQYGLHLQIVTFNDYVQPNTALNNDSIDANIFQHQPYLEGQMQSRHYALVPIAKTFVYPMGFYSNKIRSLSELRRGAVIAIPNDPSNGGRSLLLLEKAGLIALKPGAGTYAKPADIIKNPLALQFRLLDAAQLPRVLKDADMAAITNDFIGPTGLTISQAVLKEDRDSPYANLIVVRQGDENNPVYKKLVAVMHSPSVVKAAETIYPGGAAIPAWKE